MVQPKTQYIKVKTWFRFNKQPFVSTKFVSKVHVFCVYLLFNEHFTT